MCARSRSISKWWGRVGGWVVGVGKCYDKKLARVKNGKKQKNKNTRSKNAPAKQSPGGGYVAGRRALKMHIFIRKKTKKKIK